MEDVWGLVVVIEKSPLYNENVPPPQGTNNKKGGESVRREKLHYIVKDTGTGLFSDLPERECEIYCRTLLERIKKDTASTA